MRLTAPGLYTMSPFSRRTWAPLGELGLDLTVLCVPAVEPLEFERNFVRLAVCELRFPTLLELENASPVAFQDRKSVV